LAPNFSGTYIQAQFEQLAMMHGDQRRADL